jgi:hypothetical protein
VGALPTGVGVDTLQDGQPFQICWSGDDSDGVVIRYKVDVGSYSGPLTTSTCATFNDTTDVNSIGLASGVYNLTLTAVDNAYAVGKTNFLFVVNHDPVTWFDTKGDPVGPTGFYSPPFLGGNLVDPTLTFTFHEGDTIPYRSTVWFNWNGEDLGRRNLLGDPSRPAVPFYRADELNCLNGFSLELRGGTRNGGEAYVIGFLNEIPGSPPRRFLSNEPNYLRQAGFNNLVLDSLDAGLNMFMLVASRDCSNRADGTKAAFRFNCNFRPFIDSLSVEDGFQGEPGKIFTWFTHDLEDGVATRAKLKLDATSLRTINTSESVGFPAQFFVPDSTFANLAPSNPHSMEIWAIDRAEYQSDSSRIIYFDLVPPGPTKRPTRRP